MRRPRLPARPRYKQRITELEDKITQLEGAVFEPEGLNGLYAIINRSMMQSFYGDDDKSRKTQTQILNERFEAAMKYLGVEVKKRVASERFVAHAEPVKKKAKK